MMAGQEVHPLLRGVHEGTTNLECLSALQRGDWDATAETTRLFRQQCADVVVRPPQLPQPPRVTDGHAAEEPAPPPGLSANRRGKKASGQGASANGSQTAPVFSAWGEVEVVVQIVESNFSGAAAGTAKPRRKGKGKRHKGGDDETIGWRGRWPLTDPLEMTSCINCGTAMAVIGLVSHWAGCKNRKRGRKVSVGGPVTSGTLQFVGLDKPLGSGKKVANGAADNPKRLLSPANGMEASAASSSQSLGDTEPEMGWRERAQIRAIERDIDTPPPKATPLATRRGGAGPKRGTRKRPYSTSATLDQPVVFEHPANPRVQRLRRTNRSSPDGVLQNQTPPTTRAVSRRACRSV
eukprot:m.83489 g.83489  ORF g.83489 m.83489 type:complete len:351 (+) comp19644_c0_seq1:66-1118(+)